MTRSAGMWNRGASRKPISWAPVLLYVVVFGSYSIALLHRRVVRPLGREDGPIEMIGTLCFLVGALLFLHAWYRSPGAAGRPWHLFLSLVLFICFGEELSWGQRIFGFDAPEFLRDVNRQEETNIHNLRIFDDPGQHRDLWAPLAWVLQMNRLFAIFWLVLAAGVPFLAAVSHEARRLVDAVAVPLAPLWLASLFFLHAAFFHLIYNGWAVRKRGVAHTLDELHETHYALMIASFAFLVWRSAGAAMGQTSEPAAPE